MRIAFDLDNTLIPVGESFPTERGMPHTLLGFWFREPLREGTIALLWSLQREGHSLWLYTTSYRSVHSLRWWFLLCGVRWEGIVNGERHAALVQAGHCPRCSKYPPAFGIDLLIDDAEGVAQEGQTHGFRVLTIAPTDNNWTETVRDAVRSLQSVGGISGRDRGRPLGPL